MFAVSALLPSAEVGILDEDVARVREAADLTALVGQYTQLKRVGLRQVGLCPFHAERTPSFTVNPELGLYLCFGCQAKGDAITFVRETEHLDFVGAVEWLAAKTGITLHYTDEREGEGRRRRARLVEAMEKAVEWYHQRLLTSPDAGPARSYLRSRGLVGDTVRAYRIGWAPDAWDGLARSLRLSDDVWRDTGLGYLNRSHRQTDAFRGRVLFPIFDAAGDAVAFGGRVLPGGPPPKYKNTPETALYHKGKVLYGLNWAKAAIVAADQAIVCEGYTDVIGLAAAGAPRAVATCGTALTEDHLRLLRKFARRMVLAFDADAAGQHAAERLYAWERSLDLDLAVAVLPDGVDPGDQAQTDPAALLLAMDEAVPFLRFRMDRVLGGASLATPEGRARAAEAALAVIREHPSELVRDQYLMELADRVRIESGRLRDWLARGRRPGGAGDRANGSGPERAGPRARATMAPLRDTPETEVLRLAVHQPAAVADWLSEDLFVGGMTLAAYRALAAASTFHEALDRADPEVAELLQRLAVEETDAEPTDVLARLVEEAARRGVAEVESDARRGSYVISVAPQKLAIERLRQPEYRSEAMAELVAWLGSRSEERE
ncbi:MAG: DNA primase [Acidimicrobiales bacterium]